MSLKRGPNCGSAKINETKESFVILGILIVIIFAFCFIFVLSGSDKSGVVLTDKGIQAIDNSKFEFIGELTSYRNENGIYIISGQVKQKEDKSFDGLAITFIMYDEEGKRVRSTNSNTSNYLGNNIWEFSAFGNDADGIVISYELETIYGY